MEDVIGSAVSQKCHAYRQTSKVSDVLVYGVSDII